MYRISTSVIDQLQFIAYWPKKPATWGQVRAWSSEQKPPEPLAAWLQSQGQPLWSKSLRWLPVIGLLSLGLGFFVMTGLLLAETEQRVNLLLFLVLAWGLPSIMLLLSCLALLVRKPMGFWRFWPPAAALGSAAKPLLFWHGQWLATAYLLGYVLAFLFWVSLTDLTFVWRSTLLLPADRLLPLFDFLAWPWHLAWPQYRIDAELVALSRDFRLHSQAVSSDQTAAWWPFLLLVLLCWVLLPRLLLAVAAGFWLWLRRRQLRRHPSIRQFLHWCQSPYWQPGQSQSLSPRLAEPDGRPKRKPNPCYELSWQGARSELDWQLGLDDYRQDMAQMQRLASLPPQPLWLHLPAQGQPLAELADLLLTLPWAQGTLVLPSTAAAQQASWQAFIDRHLPNFDLQVSHD